MNEDLPNPMNPETIARTIVAQLAGDVRVLQVMLGVQTVGVLPTDHQQGLGGNALQYPLSGGIVFAFEDMGPYNVCQIGLTGMDDYTVEFGHMTVAGDVQNVVTHERMYADDLLSIFEQVTGLTLVVPTIIFIG